jgi:hypothetical protein
MSPSSSRLKPSGMLPVRAIMSRGLSSIINFKKSDKLLKLMMSPEERSREEVRREAEEYIRRLEQLLRDIRRVRMKYARLIEERLRGEAGG